MAWIYFETMPLNYVGIPMFFHGDSSTHIYLGTVDTTNAKQRWFMTYSGYANNLIHLTDGPSAQTWYHVAFVCGAHSGGAANLELFVDGSSVMGPTSRTVTGDQNNYPILFYDGGNWSEYLNGRLFAFKLYEAPLTQAEIQQEMYSVLPRRTANLWCFNPMIENSPTDAAKDRSGNGRDWTYTGTLTVEDSPPVGYGVTESGLLVPQGGIALQYARPIADIRTGNWQAN